MAHGFQIEDHQSTAYPDGRRIFVRTAETTFFLFSLIICFFCCQSQMVVGLVVSESRVPSLYFPGGIFTRQVTPASV